MPDSGLAGVTAKKRAARPKARGGAAAPVPGADRTDAVVVPERAAPAIYRVEAVPGGAEVRRARELGFNAAGVPALPLEGLREAGAAAAEEGLRLTVDLDVSDATGLPGLREEHPDWFVHDSAAPRFVYHSAEDAAVGWWDERIAAMQAAGAEDFQVTGLSYAPARVLAALLGAAKERVPGSRFFAWTPGLAEGVLDGLAGLPFDYAFSSSCWWNFRDGWLNDDGRRMARVAPCIAMAVAPSRSWPASAAERRRGLSLAATYAAGWLMPAGFELAAGFDLSGDVAALNEMRGAVASLRSLVSAEVVSSGGADVAVLRRGRRFAALFNASLEVANELDVAAIAPRLGGALKALHEPAMDGGDVIVMEPAGAVTFEIAPAVAMAGPAGGAVDCEAPRVVIEGVMPVVEGGRFPVRRVVGELVVVEADIFADGHDKLAAALLWRGVDEKMWRRAPMALLGNDRWRGHFPAEKLGRYVFVVSGWKDFYATFVDELEKKFAAGVAVHLELVEGVALVKEAAKGGKALKPVLKALEKADDEARRAMLLDAETIALMRAADLRKFEVVSGEMIVDAEPLGARFASWYEIFPRSQAGDGVTHGTFGDVVAQLPRIAGMGFDVLYFPPIHPIGRSNRKGRNNSLTPGADDPGSPYAIGSAEGGHDAVHPELGGLDAFRALLAAAEGFGIQVALDFAIQCSPDHPWLKEHRGWFDWRPDGSLRYAENPPKKYEDIVNVDFYGEDAKPALWLALRDVVQFWVDQGVTLFRVDNPHTKPLPFWEWLIGDIRSRHADALFLAEAFTRPKVMYRLAKIGFSQSYTYFTWRNTKAELQAYLTALSEAPQREFFRPHFFVNTPDINPVFLHHSGRAGFLIRAALAATLSGLWGVYNGFELCEATPVKEGKEEYLDSEKYEIKAWDYERPGNIVAEISKLNAVRKMNAALQSHLDVRFHTAYDERVLYFSKLAADGNCVLVAISLDPFASIECGIEVPVWEFGLGDEGVVAATDLMRDVEFVWRGKNQVVGLHPGSPFCIWRIRPVGLV